MLIIASFQVYRLGVVELGSYTPGDGCVSAPSTQTRGSSGSCAVGAL